MELVKQLVHGREEFGAYSLVSDMPESVKQRFWDYLAMLDKKLDLYYREIRSDKEPEKFDRVCADFTRFLKTIPGIANARLYQKQKRCVGEILKHYHESGRNAPKSLLRELATSFASEYR